MLAVDESYSNAYEYGKEYVVVGDPSSRSFAEIDHNYHRQEHRTIKKRKTAIDTYLHSKENAPTKKIVQY